MSRNVSYLFLSASLSISGCKSNKLFSYQQAFCEVFFRKISFPFLLNILTSLSNNLPVLRGANVTSIFKSHKLF